MGLKIAYVINSVEGGGAASPVPAVIGELRAHGAEVRLFALARRDGKALPPILAAGIEARVREGHRRDHRDAYRWLLREMAGEAPDLILTSLSRATILGQMVGRRLGIPVASWQHAAFLKPVNAMILRARRSWSGLWLADSRSVAAFAEERLGIAPGRIHVWPLFRADPDRPRAAPWRSGEPVRIATLGRLHPVKGHAMLLGALAALPETLDWRLEIGGEGAERAALERRIAALGLTARVKLSGYVDDPAAFLARAHLYVQPSRSEGFCIAAHEAMLAGLPIIASRVGEMANSVTPACGRLVAPRDPEGWTHALGDLLAAPSGLGPMGEAARETVLTRFSAENFSKSGGEAFARLAALCRASR